MKMRIVKSELLSVLHSSMFKVFAVLTIALISLSVYTTGLAQNISSSNAHLYGLQILEAGSTTSLLVAFLGVSLFTKEFGRGLIIRSVINAGSIRKVLKIKFLVSSIIGLLFGALSLLLTVVGLYIWMQNKHVSFDWGLDSIIFTIRIFLLIFLSAPWGTSIGWIGRGEKATTWGFLFYRMLIIPIFLILFPKTETWLPGFTLNFHNISDGSSASKLFFGALVGIAWILLGIILGDILENKTGYM